MNYGNSGGVEILRLEVNEIDGNDLELRIKRQDGEKFSANGYFALRADSATGKTIQIKSANIYSMYEEFDFFDMSKLSWTESFPRKLYASYHPETGGSSWVGPIIVQKTQEITTTNGFSLNKDVTIKGFSSSRMMCQPNIGQRKNI